jgi:hypothetical protein
VQISFPAFRQTYYEVCAFVKDLQTSFPKLRKGRICFQKEAPMEMIYNPARKDFDKPEVKILSDRTCRVTTPVQMNNVYSLNSEIIQGLQRAHGRSCQL